MTDQALSPRVATTVRRPLSALSSPREVVRQFTPNWFTASMGAGILAVGLSLFPVALPGLRTVAEALWLFNIALFGLFCALYAARWIAYPKEAARIFGHSVVHVLRRHPHGASDHHQRQPEGRHQLGEGLGRPSRSLVETCSRRSANMAWAVHTPSTAPTTCAPT